MKNLFNFNFKSIVHDKARWLLTLIAILTIGVGQMWAYKVYFCSEYYGNWNNDSAYPKIYVTGFDGDSGMDKLSNNWWVCDVGNCEGTTYLKRYVGDTKYGEITVTVSPTNNIIYASTNSSGYVGSPREYDGTTYIYWKVAGNNIPSWWYSGDHYIQFLKNDGTYTGYQQGENLGENFIRYLVPAGKYINVEVKRAGGNVSGNFAFNASKSAFHG